ncbi:uncharacterized protein LOC113231331 [Hyposmocoma kahamanoa]|uniref:uncharacterized protein LOC113231331 n=1 Tax=Hyposmocoma kahamanoa TaxID=1477025 RepID=UPI000E6D76D8|nr:uncharacterized protein LOC113231331 [Hyposmocoma kahamanoa]
MKVADYIVYLSDDDNTSEIAESHRTNKNVKTGNSCVMETIIDVDQLPSPQKSIQSNNNIIDLCNGGNKNNEEQSETINCLSRLFEDNALLAEFVEKCLNLEHSEGMSRIINNTLMRIYNEMEQDYKYSRDFQRILLKATRYIECDPDHKFSHLKNLCESMKQHKAKKRVNLVTLDVKKGSVKRHSSEFGDTQSKKQKVNIIIDSDDEKDIPVISLDDDHNQNDLIDLDETQNCEEKENLDDHNSKSDNLLEPLFEVYRDPDIVNNLEPALSPNQPHGPSEDKQVKIKELENKIALCKRLITMYDEEEVDLDSTSSSYIKSENFKKEVVSLYEELCELTGHSPVKRRKVRLEVLEGHPTGPVKKLEKFLNGTRKDGNPPFPDFNDVIKCVTDAIAESGLNWTRQEVLKEASALFIYCGRELQRQRQQREYKYLLKRINLEHHDPADDDLELRAQLDANRLIAEKKENDILERYAMMESLPTRKPTPSCPRELNGPIQTIANSNTQSETEDDRDTDSDAGDIEGDTSNGNTLGNHIPLEVLIDTAAVAEITAKNETVVSAENQNANNEHETKRELTKPLEITSNAESINNDNSIHSNIAANNNLQVDVPVEDIETENTGSTDGIVANEDEAGGLRKEFEIDTKSELTGQIQLKSEIIIKKEPEEYIVKKLENLGEDFTVSVLDIEDPFVSIEISDSSDDEDEWD